MLKHGYFLNEVYKEGIPFDQIGTFFCILHDSFPENLMKKDPVDQIKSVRIF